MRTQRAEVHEAGEDNDLEVHGVDRVTTIELGEPMLDTWASNECSINRKLTKRPSANQTFKRNIRVGILAGAFNQSPTGIQRVRVRTRRYRGTCDRQCRKWIGC